VALRLLKPLAFSSSWVFWKGLASWSGFAKFGVAGLCAVRLAIDCFEPKECENFFAHAGYDP
jgi:hypothetical protein